MYVRYKLVWCGVERHTTPHHTTPRHDTSRHVTPHHATPHHTAPPHHATRRDATRRDATPRYTTPRHATPHHATPHHATPRNEMRNATQPNETQHNATQRNATPQRNTTPCHATERNATQRNSTPQRNTTPRHATERNATQRNAAQRHATPRHGTPVPPLQQLHSLYINCVPSLAEWPSRLGRRAWHIIYLPRLHPTPIASTGAKGGSKVSGSYFIDHLTHPPSPPHSTLNFTSAHPNRSPIFTPAPSPTSTRSHPLNMNHITRHATPRQGM